MVSAGFPHGVFPVSELLCVSLMLRIWPNLRVYSICASSVFQVPIWRHILCWTGARPATKHDFRSGTQSTGAEQGSKRGGAGRLLGLTACRMSKAPAAVC
jgi:hypothetical protein